MHHFAYRFAVTVAVALSFATCLARFEARPVAAFQDPECVLVLGPTPSVAPIAGATFTVSVLTRHPAGCVWGASSSMPFATAIAQVAENQVTLQLNPNTSEGGAPIVARAVTFSIGNRFVRVVQDGDPAATPWQIGHLFVGAGSDVYASGVYKALGPQGHHNLDTGLLLTPAPPVADLLDGAGYYTTGCVVDPTTASGNGDLFTASWRANTLSIFDGVTHQLRDVFRFVDPNTIHPYDDLHEAEVGVNTLLSAMPRAAGVAALPLAAIGVADDPSTPADEFVTPEIQAFEQVVFAADGQFYIGTQAPPTSMEVPGLGHGYLLRFRYDPLAAPADRLTLTGWWQLEAGAAYFDGHTIATSGVDQFDLSDRGTIFYTSEDAFIRTFNVNVAGGAPAAIRLKDENEQPLQVQSYGIRILPGAIDGSGNAAGDGTAGFLVATSGNTVFRVDAQGKILARYAVPNPVAVNLTPDAQFFWTADQMSGEVYRFHIASGTRESFHSGATGIFGACVKREYSAATADGECITINADGSYGPDRSACRTPPVCGSPGIDAQGQPNPECLPPGVATPVYTPLVNREGDRFPDPDANTPALDLNRPGLAVAVSGLQQIPGLSITNGVISGTIAVETCTPGPGEDPNAPTTCVFNLNVHWMLESDRAAGSVDWQASPFTWSIIHGSTRPTLGLPATSLTTLPVLEPAAIPLAVFDLDSEDHVLISVTGLPPGMEAQRRASYGDGWILEISGTPGPQPAYPQPYPVQFDIWDCSARFALDTHSELDRLTRSGVSPAEVDAALRTAVSDGLERGSCYHDATTLRFTITIVNNAPTLSPAPQTTLVNTPVSYQIPADDADGHPLTWTITNLPTGLSASATGFISGTPTVDVNAQIVTVTVADAAGASVTKMFPWTVFSNRPPVCSAATATPRLLWPPNHELVPFSIQNVTDPDGDALAIVITSISQDQPVNDKGDGNTGFDATGVGSSSGAVRAERTGNLRVPGDGRLYQVHFTASDGRTGGTCGGTVFVGVPHDNGQRSLPTDNGCRWDSVTSQQLGPCAWLNAPVLTLANRTSVAGAAINLQVTAVDPDGTPLTYSATSLPPGLSLSSSGLITGTIAASAAGGKSKKYTVTITVSDGYGTVQSTFTWTVTGP